MSYSSARHLASDLRIEHLADTELGNRKNGIPNRQLAIPPKDPSRQFGWALATVWKSPGLIVVSHFRRSVRGDISSVLALRDQDLAVKKWLEESGVSNRRICSRYRSSTRCPSLTGTRPGPSNIKWASASRVERGNTERFFWHPTVLTPTLSSCLVEIANMNAGSQPLE